MIHARAAGPWRDLRAREGEGMGTPRVQEIDVARCRDIVAYCANGGYSGEVAISKNGQVTPAGNRRSRGRDIAAIARVVRLATAAKSKSAPCVAE